MRPAWLVLALALASAGAGAVSLSGRTGLGASLHDFGGTATFSAQYHLTRHFALTGQVGFDTAPSRRVAIAALKIRRNLALEENAIFYSAMAGAYLSSRGSPTPESGWEVDWLLGLEFFLPGLPSLGLQFETGVGYRTLGEGTLRTLGSGLLGLGFHYYF